MDQTSHKNWADAMLSQIDFYERSNRKTRVDNDLDWKWYYSIMPLRRKIGLYIRPILNKIRKKKYLDLDFKRHWFFKNSTSLWEAREKFFDDLSRKEFDSFLITAICGFERFFYSRLHFEDMITIRNERAFTENLPKEYIGLPLKIFDLEIQGCAVPRITIVSTEEEIHITNKYKRYFTRRDGVDLAPASGDTVFDLGSCIGEVSMIFAAHVGPTGKVYLFDPVPLHNKYSALQTTHNPSLKDTVIINQLGVGEKTQKNTGTVTDVSTISPGGVAIDTFDLVSIDDFVKDNNIDKIDYIKMDIEGAEIDALKGASESIKKFNPTLAISCYHKGSHLWEIPELILKINPNYKILFEQHLPFECDAIIYAYID